MNAKQTSPATITVMGATGHSGRRIVETLLQAGQHVRALGRSAERLAPLAARGAEVRVGEASDAAYLTEAFRGADAAYTLLPYEIGRPGYLANQAMQGEAIVQAIRASGIAHVVFLSSLGAELAEGTGPILSMHAQEQRLRQLSETNLLMLRVGALMENFYGALGAIQQAGIVADAVAADVAIPMIATRDFADVAATALQTRDWHGHVVRELLGQRDLSYAEATRILGAAIDTPDLPYVEMPYAELPSVLTDAGFASDLAHLYADLSRAISKRRVRSLEGRNAANTTPTAFEEFAAELAQAYRAMQAT